MSDASLEPLASNVSSPANGRADASMTYPARRDDVGFADDKWPAWKVTVFVVGVCGAFWTGLAYLLVRLLT